MNIFTVITTFLNLALCSYAAFKKDNPTFSQKLLVNLDYLFRSSYMSV